MKLGVVILGLLILIPGLFLFAYGMDKVNYYESDEGVEARENDEQEEKYYDMYTWFEIGGVFLFTVGMLALLLGLLMRSPKARSRQRGRRPADARQRQPQRGRPAPRPGPEPDLEPGLEEEDL